MTAKKQHFNPRYKKERDICFDKWAHCLCEFQEFFTYRPSKKKYITKECCVKIIVENGYKQTPMSCNNRIERRYM